MKRVAALEILTNNKRTLAERFGVTRLALFGSTARDVAQSKSDIDILVDTLPGATLFDLGGLQEELNERLGVPVQIVTPEELHRFFKDKVLAEARPI